MGLIERFFKKVKRWFFKRKIAKLKRKHNVRALISALASKEEDIRFEAAVALGELRASEALTSLIEALNDTDWKIRGAAARALGELGDTLAAASLTALLSDTETRVRKAAAVALGHLGSSMTKSSSVLAGAGMPELIKLLKMTINEEHWFLDAHQKRVAFYALLNSAIFTATIAGAMQAQGPEQYALLFIGPVLIFILSIIALRGTRRFFIRFLEAYTVRLKIASAINAAISKPNRDPPYWADERTLFPDRFVQAMGYNSSQEYIDAYTHKGYQKHTIYLFSAFCIIALILFGGLVVAILKSSGGLSV